MTEINKFWTKKNTFTLIVLALCLAVYGFFPTDSNYVKGMVSSIIFLIVTPILYIKWILKEPLSDYGFTAGDQKKGWVLSCAATIVSLLILYLFINYTDLVPNYPIPDAAKQMFDVFLLLFFSNALFLTFHELIFRSLFMTLSREHLKVWTIPIQALLVVLLFTITANLDWAAVPYVITAVFSGIIFYYSKSIIFSFTYSLFYFLLFEVIIIALTK